MSDRSEQGVDIELNQISPEALRGLVEEFVTREGTDYGNEEGSGREWTLDEKVAQITDQLDKGEARIVFDLELGTASIVVTS